MDPCVPGLLKALEEGELSPGLSGMPGTFDPSDVKEFFSYLSQIPPGDIEPLVSQAYTSIHCVKVVSSRGLN